jgi:hypothetical protein
VVRRELPDARFVPDDFFAAVERDDARVPDDFFAAVERDDVERDDVDRVVREAVVRRRDPPLARRSEAGISSVATALVSCGSSFCRKPAMRSSCLRYSRASFSVSLSPTVLASVSIAT